MPIGFPLALIADDEIAFELREPFWSESLFFLGWRRRERERWQAAVRAASLTAHAI